MVGHGFSGYRDGAVGGVQQSIPCASLVPYMVVWACVWVVMQMTVSAVCRVGGARSATCDGDARARTERLEGVVTNPVTTKVVVTTPGGL